MKNLKIKYQKSKYNPKILIDEIIDNKDKIIEKVRKNNVLGSYLKLKDDFEKCKNVRRDGDFQREYKYFWGMNRAGLTEKIFDKYFDLLTERERNLGKILLIIYNIPRRDGNRSIQFSFTTKMLHTIDNNLPIYDSLVGKAFNLRISGNGKERIKSCCENYIILKDYCSFLLKEKNLMAVVGEFRKGCCVNKKDISDIKIIDFFVWANESLRNKKSAPTLKGGGG